MTLASSPLAEEHFTRYASAARLAGCPADQVERFARAGVVLQPVQLRASAYARECDREDGPVELGYGGARGGGKSHWLLAQMGADDCQRYPGLKCLLLRKVGKANRENFEDLRRRLLMGLPHQFKRQEAVLEFANGSRIVAGHFQNESDIDAYLGLEYDVIGVEEATTLAFAKYDDIRTCCRSSKTGWRPRLYSTTNPGGVGHAWYKKRFIDPFTAGAEVDYRFIPATVDDNAFVNRDYRAVLDGLVGWKLRAWRYGDWDIAAGQYFTNWRRDVHVIQPFDIPRNWTVWGALDYGFTHYTAFYLLAQDSSNGDVFLVDEHGERGWLPQRHAPAILELLKRRGTSIHRLNCVVAGADVFSKRSDGTTIAEHYAEAGIILSEANDDRINGAGELLQRMGDMDADPKIRPSLYVMSRCARLIETIPALQHDPHRPEDVLKVDTDENGVGGDDWYDCFVAGTPITTIEGERAIESVKEGDLVLTRNGFRPARAVGNSRKNADVWDLILSNGKTITCTPNHPFWVKDSGWKRMDTLRYGDIMDTGNEHHLTERRPCRKPQLERPKLSSSTASLSDATLTPSTPTCGTIIGLAATIGKKVLRAYTRRFGSRLMALSRMAATFITMTATRLITTSPTLNAFIRLTTQQNIGLTVSNGCGSTQRKLGRTRNNGTVHPKGASGIASTLKKRALELLNLKTSFAINAGLTINQRLLEKRGSALINARQNGGETAESTMLIACARHVGNSLAVINMSQPPTAPENALGLLTNGATGQHAPSRASTAEAPSTRRTRLPYTAQRGAVICTQKRTGVFVIAIRNRGQKADTYALEIADDHEYFAAGVLVKNSARYGVMAARRGSGVISIGPARELANPLAAPAGYSGGYAVDSVIR